MRLSKRVDSLKGYLGTQMNERIAALRAQGQDVINLGIGDPDYPVPQHMLDALGKAVADPKSHMYPSHYGFRQLRLAIARWYERRFGVKADPDKEIVSLLGSSDGLYNIHTALLDPGDLALIPDPGYPPYTSAVSLAGGEPYYFPITQEQGWVPDLDAIPAGVVSKSNMIWLNYPNNPTAGVASLDFFEKLVHWAKKNEIWVVHDAPYADLCFDGYVAPSFLQVPGAMDVGIEFHSLSKTYNVTGWRVGMAVGNRQVLDALNRIKTHSDRGIFWPLQQAAIVALDGPDDWMADRNQMFQHRRDVVVSGLRDAGIECETPKATFYVWGKVPEGWTSSDFCFHLLDRIAVWMMPGSMYGPHGEGYFRLATTDPVERLSEAIRRIKQRELWAC